VVVVMQVETLFTSWVTTTCLKYYSKTCLKYYSKTCLKRTPHQETRWSLWKVVTKCRLAFSKPVFRSNKQN